METFEPLKIIFRNGGQCGIPVRDGIAKQFRDLERRDSRPFQDVSVADQATLRIEVGVGTLITPLVSLLNVSSSSGQGTLRGTHT